MAMEVEAETSVTDSAKLIDCNHIINCLTNNEKICFKSQQRGESDLTKVEKTNIATEIYNQNKLNFLVRFGKYLEKAHLVFFEQFSHENDEIKMILNNLQAIKKDFSVDVKNKRYEALKQMIEKKNSYFSEIEMMKRNPLLYEQLVGQYLTEEEKIERDRIEATEETTLVKVLMEGIERDDAKIKKKEQEEREDEAMEEDDEDDDDDKNNDSDSSEPDPSYTQWGEFIEDRKVIHIKKNSKSKEITLEEQELLKEEFITSMYQNFLDGKDEDFDYDSVDNNDKFDNVEMKDYDEEDKYFDSEEPETLMPDKAVEQESSEDELDIFMYSPAVSKLSKDIEKL